MKKTLRLLVATLVVVFLASSAVPNATANVVEGRTILIYTEGAFQQDFSNFQAVYGSSNTVTNTSETDFSTDLDGVDALFLPANGEFAAADRTAIADWFDGGNKLLWVAGDSDFGGFFIAQELNPVLVDVGSALRLDAGAVDDPKSNDGSSYRVVADHAGTGPIATAITAGVANVTAPFHGPTSVYYVEDGVSKDLRTSAPANVEAIILSSADSSVIDQDVSLTAGDFYLTQPTTGNYPLLAVEVMDTSMVIVSGESVFGNYKEMYGDTFEKSGEPHSGKALTDNLLDYYYDNVFKAPSDDSGLPFDFTVFLGSFAVIATFVAIRRRK